MIDDWPTDEEMDTEFRELAAQVFLQQNVHQTVLQTLATTDMPDDFDLALAVRAADRFQQYVTDIGEALRDGRFTITPKETPND